MSILKRGLKGAPVRRLQEKLGIETDGDYGPATEAAVRDWQTGNGLAADGIAGPDTFMAMGLSELVLLRVGSRGETVKKLQAALGAEPDGQFGVRTRQAVVDFQRKEGLDPDGMAGPKTLAKLDLGGFSDDVVARSELRDDEEALEGDSLPAQSASSTHEEAEPAPKKSVWGKVKGWFS